MPLRNYLAAIAIFLNEVKGKSALALSRDLDVQYKTAFVLAHKMREAMATGLKGMHIGGEGETVEIDGGYFGGYVKAANQKENRRDRRLAKKQNGKRQVVVVVRERGGSTLPAVFKSEGAAQSWIASRVAKGTKIVADEASSWNGWDARYQVDRIDHSQAYSLDGIYSNGAKSFFSRMRRAEIGHSPPHRGRISGPLRPGERVARGSPPGCQRRPGQGRGDVGDGGSGVGGLVWVLAAGAESGVIKILHSPIRSEDR
jgi:hypothetical protein